MSLQRGENIRGWGGVTKNMSANSEEVAAWRFSLFSLVLTLVVTGVAAHILAQTDIPVFAKAVLGILVLLFTLVLVSGVYSTMVRRASDSNAKSDLEEETIGSENREDLFAKVPQNMIAQAALQNRMLSTGRTKPAAETPDPVKETPDARENVSESKGSQPVASSPAEDTAENVAEVGLRPEGLNAPREGKADDLKLIKGVGPKLETLCNSLGFWHFDQIANWTAEEIAWVDSNLEGFTGRVTRDDWVAQARILAAGGMTEFSQRQ